MTKTLYRKYRPQNFSEIIGQNHIVRTLQNAIRNNRLGQAYLFTGPRGTGKTSIARILAKTINCENPKEALSCEKCPACRLVNEGKTLDIIEIDAASNTGVDNIRELRETVALPPTALKYKVYIIDEVHMLSTGAFNALLKTLEEPPTHVVFILATTEIHKVPETIISRCQRFDFARLPIQNIIEKLELIAKSEKIKIDAESLEMIAIAAEGGMRDAESLLSQVISLEDKNITTKEVEEILGTTDSQVVSEIAEALIKDDAQKAIRKINLLLDDGYDLSVFNKSLINHFRQLMLLKVSPELKKHFTYELTEEQIKKMLEDSKEAPLDKIFRIIRLLLEAQEKIATFILPQLPLEMAFIRATGKIPDLGSQETEEDPPVQIEEAKSQIAEPAPEKKPAPQKSEEILEKPAKKEKTAAPAPETAVDLDQVKRSWPKLLVDIKPYNHSLSALLSNCKAMETRGAEITLATPYDFYKDKLDNAENKLTVEEVFGKILGSQIRIRIVVDKEAFPKKADLEKTEETSHDNASLLDSALEIMGGKVIEE